MMNNNEILFGTAYYPEYTPDRDPEVDLDLMAQAGINLIRVGESVWSTWEPSEGQFNIDWLQPILDGCLSRGISVILGTPTYAVPPWLSRLHPEIAAIDPTGKHVPWGARQEADFTQPAYRFYADRIARKVVGRYASHPAIIGYQVDNEPGLRLPQNHRIFEAFRANLQEQFGSVDRLNAAWGLTHWSHRLTTWADLWEPIGNVHPQYDFAWRKFQTQLTTNFISSQAEIVRQVAHENNRFDQFVTTCIAYDVPGVDELEVNTTLDIASGNPYFPMQDDLALPAPETLPDRAWMIAGAWHVTHLADRMWASKQKPFLVTETNAGSIGDSTINDPGWDGQWRQIAWSLISRGARAIEYWHWNSLHTGNEMFYAGFLPHDQQPGRFFAEAATIGHEIHTMQNYLEGYEPNASVGILYSVPSKWALAFQPPWLPDPGNYEFYTRVERAYDRVIAPWARGVFDAGLEARVIHDRQLVANKAGGQNAEQLASSLPILIVAGTYIMSNELIAYIEQYVRSGGHAIIGIRSAYADDSARAQTRVKPTGLAELAGVKYQESSALRQPIRLSSSYPFDVTTVTQSASSASQWADLLTISETSNAEALLNYDHPFFADYPAATTTPVGSGRITIVGTQLDPDTTAALVTWAANAVTSAGHGDTSTSLEWSRTPSVRISSGVNGDGDHVYFLFNWSWQPATVVTPMEVIDANTGHVLCEYSDVVLGPWDVRVLVRVHADI